jgi:hypothetical protein
VSDFNLDLVSSRLIKGEIVWSLHFEPECSSTQDLAREAVTEEHRDGFTNRRPGPAGPHLGIASRRGLAVLDRLATAH